MKRNNSVKIIAVVAAFLIGLLCNFVARAVLPSLLPAGMEKMIGLLATLIEVAVSVVIILITVFVLKIGED